MPDIDPTSLHQPESIQTSLNPSALSLTKPNAISTTAPAPKTSKTITALGPQRVDIEPIYTSLKAAIGENWLEYKKAIGKFVIGAYSSLLSIIDRLRLALHKSPPRLRYKDEVQR